MDRSARAADEAFAFLYRSDESDRRRVGAAACFASLFHVGLFLVVWPQEAAVPEPRLSERAHYRLTTPRIKKPPPPPPPEVKPPVEKVRKMPMPAPPEIEPLPIEPIASPPVIEPVSVPAPAVMIPTPPPPAPPPPEILRVGGSIPRPERIVFIQPQYSELARRAGVTGTVILDAVIAPDGRIEDVTALKTLPLGLTEAALIAVRQWRYEPTVIRGQAVPVRMTVTVRFGLQ